MKTIPLTRGLEALVDDDDYEWLSQFNWYAFTSGRSRPPLVYAGRAGPRKSKIIMHREVIKAPPGMDVNHENGNTLDNRKKNLKLMTRSQNSHAFRRDTHPMMGVVVTPGGRFRANIMVKGHRMFKSFDTLEEAQRWRREKKP